MKCYRHPEKDALAICAVCFRGICEECTLDNPRFVCCAERCGPEALQLLAIRDQALKNIARAEPRRWASATVFSGWMLVASGGFLLGGRLFWDLSANTAIFGVCLAAVGLAQVAAGSTSPRD